MTLTLIFGPVIRFRRLVFISSRQADVSKVVEVRNGSEELTKETIDAKLSTINF